jgi:chromosome segregation ATPase
MRRCAALFVPVALGVQAKEPVSTLQFDAEAAKNRPVAKVTNLLKDMIKQLEKEAEEDEEIYDKLACWCETNDKKKNKAIKDAEAKIKDLTTKIADYTATSARLNAEIKNLKKEVADNQDALESATAIRQKELAEFNAEEKELLLSINGLKNAVTVLSKVQGGASFLQNGNVNGVANIISYQLATHSSMIESVLTMHQRDVLNSFVQAPQDFFDAAPTFKQSYAPQSGEIFGILNQMKESFETNLAETQKDEAANVAAYEDLKAAKEEEIAAGLSQIETKTDELASTDEKLAEAKEEIEDTKSALTADEEFLMMLKEKCSVTDAEWEERQKTRQEEIEACSKALSVLTSDEAHDLFTKTFNPAFVQKASKSHSERRNQASSVLMAAAKKLGAPQLSAIAMKVKLDAFE